MGFWGSEILVRSARPLNELDAIASRDQGVEEIIRFADDWQWTQVAGLAIAEDAEAMLRDLVRETGAPALTGYVRDSDCIDLLGWAPQSGLWRACLSRSPMAVYLAEEGQTLDSVFLPPAEAAECAAMWAVEAGLSPDRAALAELFRLQRHAGLVTGLGRAIGIRWVVPSGPQLTAGTLEARLAGFVDEFVAPRLESAGLERDPAGAYPRDPGSHVFGRQLGRDCLRIGIYPLEPGFVLELSMDWAGRLDLPATQGWPLSMLDGVLLGGPLRKLLVRWNRVWRSASSEAVRTLPASPDESAVAANGVEAAVDQMVRTAEAAGETEALIDIIHSHGSDNWCWGPMDGDTTVAGPLVDLAVLGFRPSFALDQALRGAEDWLRAVGPPARMDVVDAFRERLRLHVADSVLTTLGRQVRSLWQRLCDGFLTEPLTARGFVPTGRGFEFTSAVGDRVLIDLELSATSTPDRVAVYLHTGLLSIAQTEWDEQWAARFPGRPAPARRAMFGWFTSAPPPPAEFESDHPPLRTLGMFPWCFTPDTVTDCGRALAAVIEAECDRLVPLLDLDRLVAAISDDETQVARMIMALLPHGPSAALTENLQLADASPDPFVWEMAEWARTRLAGASR